MIALAAFAILIVGTDCTFAWFTAASASVTATTAGRTANTTAVAGFTDVNGFTVTVEAASITAIDDVLLTDGTGNVYSTISDGGSDVQVEASGNKIITITPTLEITYTGSASTKEEVESLWDAAISAHPVTLTISDITAYTAEGMTAAGFSTAFKNYVSYDGDDDGTDPDHVAGTHYGLKFTSGSADYSVGNDAANTAKTINVANVGFTSNPTGSGTGKTVTKTSVASGVSFYIGVIGINGVIQDADDTYSYKVAPSV